MSRPINGVSPGEWAKHLRPSGKRSFWKAHRAASLEDLPSVVAEVREERAVMKAPTPKKRFGIKLTWHKTWGDREDIIWTEWYMTKSARENAMRSKSGVLRDAAKERVDR